MKTAGCLKSFSMHNNGFSIHLVMLLLLGFCASATHATTPSAAPVSASTTKHEEVARMVLGILSYTKWQPPQTVIHLCLVAPTRYAALLENISLPDNGPKLIVSKHNYDVSTLNSHCDVIYFGDISPIQQQKVLGVRQNRPVLTISELNSNCDLGSIFCLDVESSPVSFKVNLDALAQSGVHINPNVLLLGRKKKVSP